MARPDFFFLFLLLLATLAFGASSETYDVVIIGGGSSGTYAAIHLQQLGKSVAVIERQSRPGGTTHPQI